MELTDYDFDYLVRQAVKDGKYLTATRLVKEWKGLTIEESRAFYQALPEYKKA